MQTEGWGPPPSFPGEVIPTVPSDLPPVPMYPVTTERRTGGGQDPAVTYTTPFTVAQLAEIANKITTFEPSADPYSFFEDVRQQKIMHGLDEREEVKLIVMCLSKSVRSALPAPQNVGEGTLNEMKEAILTAIGFNKGDPVDGLNKCRQRKGEHPTAFASRLWIHFTGVYGELDWTRLNESDSC